MIQRSGCGVTFAGNAVEVQISQKQNVAHKQIKINIYIGWAFGCPRVVGCLCLMCLDVHRWTPTCRAAGECQRTQAPLHDLAHGA